MNNKKNDFFEELRDFKCFIKCPNLTPSYIHYSSKIDHKSFYLKRVKRILTWAIFLWILDIFVLGPIVNMVAINTEVQHKLNNSSLSWFKVILFAPVLEEFLFRYGLRKPIEYLVLCPLIIFIFILHVRLSIIIILGIILFILYIFLKKYIKYNFFRNYIKYFPYIFHIASILFALLHILNFSYIEKFPILMPILVLPQWITGMVLGWIRVRCNTYDSILLHALFNSFPFALLWFLKY